MHPTSGLRDNRAKQTYLPLGEAKLRLAATLSNESLLLVQAAADGTGGNGQVAVVAIIVRKLASHAFLSFGARHCSVIGAGRVSMSAEKMVGGQTYVKPAAFQAAVILAVLIEARIGFGG